MSPTYERSARFERDMRKLTGEQRRAFLAARDELVAGLRAQPSQFAPRLRAWLAARRGRGLRIHVPRRASGPLVSALEEASFS